MAIDAGPTFLIAILSVLFSQRLASAGHKMETACLVRAHVFHGAGCADVAGLDQPDAR